MRKAKISGASEILRLLPSIDTLIHTPTANQILAAAGAKHLTALARSAIDSLRQKFLENHSETTEVTELSREDFLKDAEKKLGEIWKAEKKSSLQRVINATGVIIHTNLGRAPLSENAKNALIKNASGYCTLEYDLETGKRGKRGGRAERLLAEITGAENALIVNNCAAAAYLVLTVFAKGGEAIISRGELVEIGGDFRIPDVLEQSGATLREVGATNRTRLSDYENAVSEQTRMILKVHPSNYRIVGFTAAPELSELAELAHRKNILLYEDAGSGAIFDLREFGLTDEPIIGESIRAGADVVTFSGDKLLGGVQAGLIVGKSEIIEKLRKHPLYRALRVDKLIYAALEATLESFRREAAFKEIPVLRMLAVNEKDVEERAIKFARHLQEKPDKNHDLNLQVSQGKSVVGGGSAPTTQPPTSLLVLKHAKMSVENLEQALRFSNPPVIARILDDQVLIDLRTVSAMEEIELAQILLSI